MKAIKKVLKIRVLGEIKALIKRNKITRNLIKVRFYRFTQEMEVFYLTYIAFYRIISYLMIEDEDKEIKESLYCVDCEDFTLTEKEISVFLEEEQQTEEINLKRTREPLASNDSMGSIKQVKKIAKMEEGIRFNVYIRSVDHPRIVLEKKMRKILGYELLEIDIYRWMKTGK